MKVYVIVDKSDNTFIAVKRTLEEAKKYTAEAKAIIKDLGRDISYKIIERNL